jgi:hypothetical protein
VTILGWSAGVCLVAYVPFVAYALLVVGTSDAEAVSSGEDPDRFFQGLFWFLFSSPVLGGVIGVVRAVRGTSVRTKLAWSGIGIALVVVSWFVLAYAGIALLFALPGVD